MQIFLTAFNLTAISNCTKAVFPTISSELFCKVEQGTGVALKRNIRNRGEKRFLRNAKNNHVSCLLPELEPVLPSGSSQKIPCLGSKQGKKLYRTCAFRKQLWIRFIHLLVFEPVE